MSDLRPRLGALTAAALLSLAACQQQPAATGNAGAVAETGTAPAAAPAATGVALWNGGQPKPLDIQVAHPSGVVMQVSSIQSRATDTTVGIRVINGREQDVDLNRFNTNRDGYLLLDSGEKLYVSPPATNAKLTVPAGQTFEGELVFLGRLPQARSAVLVLNEDSSTSNEFTSTPGFRIDLPLGTAAPAAAPTGAAQ